MTAAGSMLRIFSANLLTMKMPRYGSLYVMPRASRCSRTAASRSANWVAGDWLIASG